MHQKRRTELLVLAREAEIADCDNMTKDQLLEALGAGPVPELGQWPTMGEPAEEPVEIQVEEPAEE